MDDLSRLVAAIARVGLGAALPPPIDQAHPFKHFFTNGELDRGGLDARDGRCTRRELLTRMLLLNAALDQGPDIKGVRGMMTQVINDLYEREVRIFHTPLDFFKEVDISVSQLQAAHELAKESNADEWARVNQSSPQKHNLFMDKSRQVLNYAIFRWGVPLALPYLLDKKSAMDCPTSLLDYLESYESAEQMSVRLKDHETFGLGKAIGDKACHLFAKWLTSTFRLTRKVGDTGWGDYSYEVPLRCGVNCRACRIINFAAC